MRTLKTKENATKRKKRKKTPFMVFSCLLPYTFVTYTSTITLASCVFNETDALSLLTAAAASKYLTVQYICYSIYTLANKQHLIYKHSSIELCLQFRLLYEKFPRVTSKKTKSLFSYTNQCPCLRRQRL